MSSNGSTEKDKTLKELFAEYGQSLTDSWGRETLLVDYQRFKALMIEWLEQKLEDEKEKAFPETVVLHELIEELSSN